MIQFKSVLLLAVVPVAVASAGINFSSTENGSSRPSWGRTQQSSWGLSGFLVTNINKMTGELPVTNPATAYDPFSGTGANNPMSHGYQVGGPKGTRLIYDRLVAQNVIHVLGTDTDDMIGPEEDPYELFFNLRPEIAGFALMNSGVSQATQVPGGTTPDPNPVPEPASAALVGAAALLIGLRRPGRDRA